MDASLDFINDLPKGKGLGIDPDLRRIPRIPERSDFAEILRLDFGAQFPVLIVDLVWTLVSGKIVWSGITAFSQGFTHTPLSFPNRLGKSIGNPRNTVRRTHAERFQIQNSVR